MPRISTLTQKGQVTIPKNIRDALGLRPHDKLRFSLEHEHVRVQRAYPSLKDIVASIPAIDVPMENWDEIIEDDMAQRYAETFL